MKDPYPQIRILGLDFLRSTQKFAQASLCLLSMKMSKPNFTAKNDPDWHCSIECFD